MSPRSQWVTFDDVLILPRYSEILPHQADCSSSLSEHCHLNIPILSAAMDTVTEHHAAIAMALLGGLGVIHKNMTAEQQAQEVRWVKSATPAQGSAVDANGQLMCAAAVGVDDAGGRLSALISAGVNMIVIDTAHGHSKAVLETTAHVRKHWGNKVTVVAGNIATADAALALRDAGAHAVKVGIGPGSICTTRMIAGIGCPQFSAIQNVSEALKKSDVTLIADGGIKYSGDLVKALAAGAHAVMLGSLLAGTDEAPGDIVTLQGKAYKQYRGMGSLGAMKMGSKDRYFQAQQQDKKLVPEGIEGQVPYRGAIRDVLHQMVGGLRAGMGYTGSARLKDLRENAEFVQITASGLRESHVHDVYVTAEAPNYSPKY